MIRLHQSTIKWFTLGLLGVALLILLFSRSSRSFLVGLCSSAIITPQVGQSFIISCGPIFNQFPVSYSPKAYADWPLLDGRNVTKGKSWSNSQADHDHGIDAEPGDVIEIYIYFHNGGIDSESCEEADAVRTIIQTFSAPSLGRPSLTHRISGIIWAANAPAIESSSPGKGGDLRVQIQGGIPQSLTLVLGSVQKILSREMEAKTAPLHLLDSIFDGGIDVGTIFNGSENAGFVIFKLEVSKAI